MKEIVRKINAVSFAYLRAEYLIMNDGNYIIVIHSIEDIRHAMNLLTGFGALSGHFWDLVHFIPDPKMLG